MTLMNLKNVRFAGALWETLKERYLKATLADRSRAISNVVNWKKKPRSSLEESLEEIERFANELHEQTNLKFQDEILRMIWMQGLPEEYSTAVQNI